MLESYIKEKLKKKDILLMTHIVMGYPSFDDSYRIVKEMVEAGVDLMELQVPFSEPMADGPVILRANQDALKSGARVSQSLELAEQVAGEFDIPFLIMGYYNTMFRYGVDDFIKEMAKRNLKGSIIPDLPPEEGEQYLPAMERYSLDPILLFSPTTPFERMKYIAQFAKGFIYCVARKGVTGKDTDFSESIGDYLAHCRRATDLPLAVGFGVKEKKDVDFLKGKAEIAIIGTETIRVVEKEGINAVGGFIRSLR